MRHAVSASGLILCSGGGGWAVDNAPFGADSVAGGGGSGEVSSTGRGGGGAVATAGGTGGG